MWKAVKEWFEPTPTPAPPIDEIWPDTRTTRELNAAVYAMQVLLDNEPAWVHRRVERIEFLDKGEVRRQMSVDFTLPRLEGDAVVPYVPLSVVRKHVMKNLDTRDEENKPLPVLTRRQSAPIAAEFLVGIARLRLSPEYVLPQSTEEDADDDLHRLAADLRLIAGERDEKDFGQLLRLQRDAFERLANATTAPAAALWADYEYARPWIVELADQFILFVETPTTPLRRRVLKFSYDQSLVVIRVGGWSRPLSWLVNRAGDLIETLGLKGYHALVPAQAIVDAESYHAEVTAPDGVYISHARLRTQAWESDEWKERDRDGGTHRASLYAAGVAESESEVKTSLIDVWFRLRPEGLLVAAFLSSLVTTGILWLGIYLTSEGIEPRREALTALLVALPALLAAYLVPREHPLTRRMFKGVRGLLALTALVSFIAASTLALDFENSQPLGWGWEFEPSVKDVWWVLALISTGISAVISAALLMSWGTLVYRRKSGAPSDR